MRPWERYWLDPDSHELHRCDEIRAARVQVWLPVLEDRDRTPWDKVTLDQYVVSRGQRPVVIYARSHKQAQKAWRALSQ
jgi:hypothetical protein